MVKQISLSTNESYQSDFLKVVVLNHSKTHFIVFHQQNINKNEMFEQSKLF